MKRANSFRFLVAGAVVAAVALVGMRVYADDANDIEQFYSINSYVQWDNTAGSYPIITAIGSQPGTFGGHLYTGWSVFAEDGSGSMNLFISQGTLTNMPGSHPTSMAVGDQVNVAGQWSPFHSIPELGFSTVPASNNYFTTISTGNTPSAPPVFTISQLTGSGMGGNYQPGNLGIAGYYLEIDNATISGSTGSFSSTFPTYAQANVASETYTITDNTGSMTFFDWVTSYSAAGQLGGSAVPTGPVTLYGFISYNTGGPLEFTAFKIVPEPSTIALVGAGLLGLLAVRRRRS